MKGFISFESSKHQFAAGALVQLYYWIYQLIWILICCDFCSRMLGVITRKDILRHIELMNNLDPESVMFSWLIYKWRELQIIEVVRVPSVFSWKAVMMMIFAFISDLNHIFIYIQTIAEYFLIQTYFSSLNRKDPTGSFFALTWQIKKWCFV